MIPKEITRATVVQAIRVIDETGVPRDRSSKTYYLKMDGKLYPPKYVLSVASSIVLGRELMPNEFGGGEETNTFLENLGFEIIPQTVANLSEKSTCVTTVVIQSKSSYEVKRRNKSRQIFLAEILKQVPKSDLVLFPAGFFEGKRQSKFNIEAEVRIAKKAILDHSPETTVCFGIDFCNGVDQLALAVDATGLIALGRKFSPTKSEAGYIHQAASPFDAEYGLSRIFSVNDKKFYLAVCYDCFGLQHKNIKNPGVDILLVLSHQFQPWGQENSGDVDFVRKGVAGASKQWNCPTFVASVFFDREIPTSWPTGVDWDGEGRSVKTFKYSENGMNWSKRSMFNNNMENAICYTYNV